MPPAPKRDLPAGLLEGSADPLHRVRVPDTARLRRKPAQPRACAALHRLAVVMVAMPAMMTVPVMATPVMMVVTVPMTMAPAMMMMTVADLRHQRGSAFRRALCKWNRVCLSRSGRERQRKQDGDCFEHFVFLHMSSRFCG